MRCLNAKNCVIVCKDGGGAHLSRLTPNPYCIPCYVKKYKRQPPLNG